MRGVQSLECNKKKEFSLEMIAKKNLLKKTAIPAAATSPARFGSSWATFQNPVPAHLVS